MAGRRHLGRLAVTTLAAGLAAGVGLTGCGSPANPGAAAQVGDDTISVSYLQKQLDEAIEQASSTGQGQQPRPGAAELGESQRAVLQQLIYDAVIVATGDRLGVTASQASIDKVKGEMRAQQAMVPSDMVEGFARWVALRRELNARLLGRTPTSQAEQAKADELLGNELAKTAREIGVTVNPRYGRWNGSQLVPDGQLVTPAPTKAAPQLPQAPSVP